MQNEFCLSWKILKKTMDQKSWLRKKRSTEKTLSADKANNSIISNEEETEVQELLTEKAELERDLRVLNDKLSSALSECSSKDNFAKKQVKIAQEAIAGDLGFNNILSWEKAETEAISLKKDLDKVLQQKAASEERLSHLDAALKECMQQLLLVREEQEKRIHSAVMKTSEEFEKTRIALDVKLAEGGKRIAKLDAENTQLNKALSGKDKVIEELSNYRAQLETDLNALMLRVESTEKENASLKYEVRVLEKELDIRHEEREFNCRTADAAQKQHLESVKKIAKLESECQRLRLLVRKRLPGPATVTRMKNEVEMLGKDQVERRRRKSNPSLISSMDFSVDMATDTPSKRINFLTEQLQTMAEENKSLKYALNKKSSELQFSRTMYARTASRLSQGDGQAELLKGQTTIEPGKYPFFLQEHCLATLSDLGSDDKASCGESWASALLSELEHFKNEKKLGTPSHRYMGASDMNLMDDFAEMEKLAVVSVDYPAESTHHSSEDGNAIIGPSGSPSGGHSSPTPGSEMVPVHCCPSEISGQEIQSDNIAANRVPGRLADLLKMLLEHCQASQRNPHEVLEDMKVALVHYSSDATILNGKGSTNHPDASYSPEVSRDVFQTSQNKSFTLDASDTGNDHIISTTKKSDPKFQSNASTPIHKILELLEGINIISQDNGVAESFPEKDDKLLPCKNSATPPGYMVRVFQWKTAELSAVLQQFVQTCNDLLNGNADLEQFARLVASNLEWVMNHCFSLQDVSSMKEAIRSHSDCDESRSESEVDTGSANLSAESNRVNIQREDMPYLSMVSPLNGHNISHHMKALQPNTEEEAKRLNIKPANKESSIINLEGRLESQIVKVESFRIRLQDSKDIIEDLQSEMETMKQSKGNTGNQIEKQKMMKEDLESQIMETNLEWRKPCQKISHLENDLENNNKSLQRLEEKCNDLKIQLKCKTSREVPDDGKPRGKQLRNDWEITSASEKLAECQETILNLGKQLKALASSRDAAVFDRVISTPANPVGTRTLTPQRNGSQRLSLLDKMLAEDNDQIGLSPRTKDDIQNGDHDSAVSTNAAIESWSKFTDPNRIDRDADRNAAFSMAIVPRKKNEGRSFLKKLFWQQKKGNIKKTPFS
ncbi:hypothetical protein Pfo_008666 [Paulownia fortunei]|nr:hypothetical protein Pfo_008666 [Paulownia fortunei]